MNQVKWTFVGIPGRPYNVGLYHSPSKGHLLIYCNGSVVLVRFGVKEDSMFSFFIEEELIEIHITKNEKGNFEYEFRVNKDVDTVYNQQRKKVYRENNIKLAIIIGSVFVVVASVVAAGFFYTKSYHARLLAEEGTWVEAVAVINEVRMSRDYFALVYNYNNRSYHSKPVYFTYPYFTTEGFVLYHGDPFQVKIATSRPDISDRDSFLISKSQPQVFIQRGALGLMQYNTSFSEQGAICIAENVLDQLGAEALAVLAAIPYEEYSSNPFTKIDIENLMQHARVRNAIQACR